MTRVLYVDDEPDIREIAEMSLSLDPDFEVQTAGSGAEALDVVGEWRPDVILLDVMMPVMDGPAVLARLRELGIATPVVFVTARAQRSDIHSFATLDAKGVIAKPFNPISLAAEVRAFL
jgi:two-component system OmpR family response regulator